MTNTSQLTEFFTQYSIKSYIQGDILIEPDLPLSHITYLASGNVREYTITAEGNELTIHLYTSHSFFPLHCVLNQEPNRYYYEAINPVTAHLVPIQEFQNFLETYPELCKPILHRMLKGLDKLIYRLEILSSTDAYQRTISTLLYLHRHFGNQSETLSQKFSHQQIATFSGLTRETVTRQLKKLTVQGLIRYQQQSIIIPDVEQLKALLHLEKPTSL